MMNRRSVRLGGIASGTLLLFLGLVPLAFGQTGLSYLRIGAGARSVAMGNAVVSNVDDASANYWNPGALGLLSSSQGELMHNESIQGVRYEFASIADRLGHRLAAGLAFNGVWTDRMNSYDNSGNYVGQFGYYGVAMAANVACALTDWLGVGVGGEYLREAIDVYSASGPALNAGIQARGILPGTDLGISVMHLGPSVKYESQAIDLPTTFQAGVSHLFAVPAANASLLLAAEYRKERDETGQLLLGTEWVYRVARLQVGYRSGLDTQDVSFGVGVGNNRIRGQYSYVPFGESLGEQHRFSLLFAW